MSALTLDFWPHGEFRAVSCCICHRAWNEVFLGVVLRDEQRFVGSICPRCIDGSPLEAGLWVLEYGRSLTVAVRRLGDSLKQSPGDDRPSLSIDHRVLAAAETAARMHLLSVLFRPKLHMLRERIEQTRYELEEVCVESAHWAAESERRRQRGGVCVATAPADHRAATMRGEAGRIRELVQLADNLASLDDWSMSLTEVICRERRIVAKQFEHRSKPVDLASIVDSRYRSFLERAA